MYESMQLREQVENKKFEELLARPIPQEYIDLDINHFSPTDLNKSAGIALAMKTIFTQEERRKFYVGPKATFGNYVGNNHPMMVADKIWLQGSECLIIDKHNRYSWDGMMRSIEDDMKMHDLDFTEVDKQHHKHHKKIYAAVVENWHKAYKAINLQGEIECEPTVYADNGTPVQTLGRIDYRGKHAFIEFKTKPPRRGKLNAKGTYGFSSQKLPDEVQIEHARQTAFYWSTNKDLKPFVAYVNEKGFKIFDPSNSDMLTVAAMEDHVEYYRQQAQKRANLIEVSKGDLKTLLGLIDPQFDHMFYWNIGDQFVIKAKETINKALRRKDK